MHIRMGAPVEVAAIERVSTAFSVAGSNLIKNACLLGVRYFPVTPP
jgi:hypothetical protein